MRVPRHDPVEVRRLLEQRDTERLTYRQLSERSGVPVHVLTYRMRQDRLASQGKASVPADFIEVVDVSGASNGSLEVIGPRGHRVVVNSLADEGLLGRVLRALPC